MDLPLASRYPSTMNNLSTGHREYLTVKRLLRDGSEQLSTDVFEDRCRATEADVRLLRQLAIRPGRRAGLQLKALALLWSYGHGKPAQRVDVDTTLRYVGSLQVHVIQAALSLPPAAMEAYLRDGRLPARAFLPEAEQGIIEAEVVPEG